MDLMLALLRTPCTRSCGRTRSWMSGSGSSCASSTDRRRLRRLGHRHHRNRHPACPGLSSTNQARA